VPNAVTTVQLPFGFHVGQDLRVDLQVPGVVELARLADRACRRNRIAAARKVTVAKPG
jgi:hypothetical protein